MKKLLLIAALSLIALPCSSLEAQEAKFAGGILAGYNRGVSAQAHLMVSNFAQDFPMMARFGISYANVDPGNSLDARRIFINDNTNGVPEKNGTVWDFRLDLLYNLKLFSINRSYLYGGPRYSTFNAHYDFIGGNEIFDISSDQWGIGLGLETYFAMSQKIDLVISTGVDHFFENTIEGHDTAYSPDGENINPRRDYTYDTADDAIRQPKTEFRILAGINYNF